MDHEDGKPLKALVLCAGFGTRLKPLTDVIPKPLVTVLNVPLIDAAIQLCVKAGAKDIAINTHHLASKMANHVRSIYQTMGAHSLYISEEVPEILGTGGALSAVTTWWGRASLLVYNGDILSNMRLDALVARHRQSKSFVTMAVTKTPPSGGGRSVWVGRDGIVKAIAKPSDLPKNLDTKTLEECGFACAYVAEPELAHLIPQPPRFHDVIESFQAAIGDGRKVSAFRHEGFWADVGTHQSLWETNLMVAQLGPREIKEIFGSIPLNQGSSGWACAKIDDKSVVSPLAHIGDGASITSSVILEGGSVATAESVAGSLRGPGFSKTFA